MQMKSGGWPMSPVHQRRMKMAMTFKGNKFKVIERNWKITVREDGIHTKVYRVKARTADHAARKVENGEARLISDKYKVLASSVDKIEEDSTIAKLAHVVEGDELLFSGDLQMSYQVYQVIESSDVEIVPVGTRGVFGSLQYLYPTVRFVETRKVVINGRTPEAECTEDSL
jgi:hypothetical protein